MDKETVYSGIFGGVVADALGVPYEFNSREEMMKNPASGMTGYGTYNQPPGSWSDDSSLTLATLESLTGGINYEDMIDKFCQWYQDAKYTPNDDVFDCGITTSNSLENHISNHQKAVNCGMNGVRDNGDGSLMRIMPASLYLYVKDYSVKEQIDIIDNISSLTHAHAISKASCNIYNFVVQEVLNCPERSFKELIEEGLEKSKKYYDNSNFSCFERIYDDLFLLSEDSLSSKGYVVYSLEVSLYCCYHTKSFKEAVLKAVNLGMDTDTNAMITGGLAALYYGFDSIPEEWLEQIIRKKYIEELCDNFHNSL